MELNLVGLKGVFPSYYSNYEWSGYDCHIASISIYELSWNCSYNWSGYDCHIASMVYCGGDTL